MGREIVCQICGASGYMEFLSYCIMCKTYAAHLYCLGKALCNAEEVRWLCDPCKNKPSEVILEKSTAKMLNVNKSQENRITASKLASVQKPHNDVTCRHSKENLACSTHNRLPVGDLSQSRETKFEGKFLKKKRKLILLEDDELDEIVHASDKRLKVMKPIDMSDKVCHRKHWKGSIRKLNLQDEDHLDEEVHVKKVCQFSPIRSSSQIRTSIQVAKHRTRRTSNWAVSHQPSKLSAQPIIHYIWRGYFDVCCEKLGPLQAHLSSKACKNVWNIASILPRILQITKLPRLDSWPKSFKTSPPNDDNIALYFFAQDAGVEAALNKLLDDVTRNDLTLKFVLDEAELLAFSSTILPEGCQKFQGKCYLWGLFRRRQGLESCALADSCPKPNETIAKIRRTPEFKHPTEKDLDNTAENCTSMLVDNSCSKKGQVKCLDENARHVTQAANINLSVQHCPVEDCPSPNEIPEREVTSDFKHAEEEKFDDIPDKQLMDNSKDFEGGEIKCHDGRNGCSETQGDLKHAEEEKYDDISEDCRVVERQLMDNSMDLKEREIEYQDRNACSETQGDLKHAEEEKYDDIAEDCTVVERLLMDNSMDLKEREIEYQDRNACSETQVGSITTVMEHLADDGCPYSDEITEAKQCRLDIEHARYELEDAAENGIILEELVENEHPREGEIECHDENAYFVNHGGEITFLDCLMSCRKKVRLKNVPGEVPSGEQIISQKGKTKSSDDEEANNQEHFGLWLEDEEVGGHQLSLFPEKVEDIAMSSRFGGSNAIDLELGLGQSYRDQNMHHKCMTGDDSAGDLFLGSAIFL